MKESGKYDMKKNLFILFFMLFGMISLGFSQGTNNEDTNPVADLSTPQMAVKTILDNQQDDRNFPDIAAKALFKGSLKEKERIKLVIKLKQIYDGLGVYLYTDKMPSSPNYVDSVSKNQVFIIDRSLPMFYLQKTGGQWLLSKESVSQIETQHRQVYRFGTHVLLNWLSGFGNDKFMGMYIWQLIGILIISFCAFLLHKLLSFLFKGIIGFLIRRWAKMRMAGKLIMPVARPMSLLIVLYFVSVFIPVLLLNHPKAESYVIGTINVLIPVCFMIVLYKLVDVLIAYLKKLAEKTSSTLDDQLVPLLSKALKVFVIVVGVIFILDNFNYDVTALVTGLGIGGFALALASQDMLKNFFGSIMIFMDRPFQVGDWIVGDSIDGDIEEVGFRATRIRTFHNSVTYVPNGMLADMTIDNMGMRKFRRYKTYLGVTYDTPPELLDTYVKGLRKIVDHHPATRKDYYNIYVNAFNSSSIDILVYIFFEVPTWPQELEARHEFNLLAIKLADDLGVRFAFPTQTLHVEDMPGHESKTPQHNDTEDEMNNKISAWIAREFQEGEEKGAK